MSSATYPILGVQEPDYRSIEGGELMYARGGAVSRGDVKLVSLHGSDAAVDGAKLRGSTDAPMGNVEPVAAGTNSVNLKFGFYRVCTQVAGVVDDKAGVFAGKKRCLVKVKVTHGGGAVIGGTPLVPVAAQVHLAVADLTSPALTKVVAILAYDQTLASGVNLVDAYFDGEVGFGIN